VQPHPGIDGQELLGAQEQAALGEVLAVGDDQLVDRLVADAERGFDARITTGLASFQRRLRYR
jgi:hypothetical protein